MSTQLWKRTYFKRTVATIISAIAFPFFSGSLLGFVFFATGFCCIATIITQDLDKLAARDRIKNSIESMPEHQLADLLDPAALEAKLARHENDPNYDLYQEMLPKKIEQYRRQIQGDDSGVDKMPLGPADIDPFSEVYETLEQQYPNMRLGELLDAEKFENFLSAYKDRPNAPLYRSALNEIMTLWQQDLPQPKQQTQSPLGLGEDEEDDTPLVCRNPKNPTTTTPLNSPEKPPATSAANPPLAAEAFRQCLKQNLTNDIAPLWQKEAAFFARSFLAKSPELREALSEAEATEIMKQEASAFLSSSTAAKTYTPLAQSQETTQPASSPVSAATTSEKVVHQTPSM